MLVPVHQMHQVTKYGAHEGAAPKLSKMGGADWARTKGRVSEALAKIADGLVELYAEREMSPGHAFAPDTPWQAELEEAFPYEPTPDQAKAIDDTKADMERARPMDRLVCGDVGYGKTEVAVRAAFKAIADKKQVAILVPTTLLASQHHRTFSQRFASFPVRIEELSRFKTKKEQQATLAALADGQGRRRRRHAPAAAERRRLPRSRPDHRRRRAALRRDAQGAAQADARDRRRAHALGDADSAHAADVADGRARSLADPHARRATACRSRRSSCRSRDAIVQHAITAELDRGGQVYYVHNRIESIYGVARALEKLVPKARIAVGHGQMHEHELEPIMAKFIDGEIDVFVSTTIIENGIDIPNVNTIIVHDADKFGLAQLYQLRGRVGRSNHQAYAFSALPGAQGADRRCQGAARSDPRVHAPRFGLADRDARPRDSRRGQPARRRAVGLHRRGRLRNVRAAAGRGDLRAQGRAGRHRTRAKR